MTEIIQAAIRASGLSLNEVGRRSGVDPGAVSRFMRNQRTVTLPHADALCRVLGLELRSVRKANERTKGRV